MSLTLCSITYNTNSPITFHWLIMFYVYINSLQDCTHKKFPDFIDCIYSPQANNVHILQIQGVSKRALQLWKLIEIYLTPMHFFLWGFVKDQVFVPPLPANVVELRTRITAAVARVTPEMLRSVWQETDYRWEVCRITNGSHIEP